MMHNPFQKIDEKLSKIESLILDLKKESTKVEIKEETEELLTVDGLADYLHLAKPTIYSNYSKGLIPGGCKQGKRVLFSKKIILEWVKSGRKLTNAEIDVKAENYLSNRIK